MPLQSGRCDMVVKQLFENGNSWKTLGIILGIIMTLTTITSWKFMADAQEKFQTKRDSEKLEVRVNNNILEIKADIREMRLDLKEITNILGARIK